MPNKKISDLTVKGASLAATDLIEISESNGQGGYISKSVTGANVLSSKQDTLVSATNIKTVNSTTLLGAGDIPVQATLVSGTNIKTVNSTTLLGAGDLPVQPTLVSGTNIKTVNSTNILGAGDVAVQATLVSGTNIKTVNNTTLLGSGNVTVQDTITLTTTGSSGASTLVGATLNIPQYSGATPSGVAGAIQFTDGTNFSSDATNLSFDNTNDRLGVGQNVPTARVHIKGAGATNATTSLLVHNSSSVASLQCTDDLSVFSHGKGAVATNTVYGKGAFLGTAPSGANNVAIGLNALAVVTTGTRNTAIGSEALDLITTGYDNVAIGYGALTAASASSNGNTGIGKSSLNGVTSGTGNTAIGADSGLTLQSGSNNIAIGYGQTFQTATAGTIMIGVGDTSTGNNQCRFGSTSVNAGLVAAEGNTSANVWNVFINGVARKILLA